MMLEFMHLRNPPDELGVREEWKVKTGWHRKEDIYLQARQREDANNKEGAVMRNNLIRHGGDHPPPPAKRHPFVRQDDTKKLWAMSSLIISLVLVVCYSYFNRNRKYKRRSTEFTCGLGGRGRKAVEDIV